MPPASLSLLKSPKFATLFGPDSLSEIPVIGTWKGHTVSGQIDKLVILPNEVWIIDFKTNRHVPKTETEVPQAYYQQLNAYAGLISQIFPGKLIKTFLLWTETLTLMEIQHD